MRTTSQWLERTYIAELPCLPPADGAAAAAARIWPFLCFSRLG